MRSFYIVVAAVLLSVSLSAQRTTATITGNVVDDSGEPLIGATVVATHVPSGTNFGTVTQVDGGYTLPNLRVGGPYTVESSFIGYSVQAFENVTLSLGQKLPLDFVMQQEGVTTDEVVITGSLDPILNNKRTGAETSIGSELINNLPTISRSAQDYTRLNPQSAAGGSFGGRNDQFNNYSLDGSIFNNPFGLDAATPGGQSDAQPVSLDAIDQINVAIAPFDVTQSGFTGAAINAVTKSGTNEIKGSVFGFYRSAGMTGGSVDGTSVNKGDLQSLQFGASVGGPIIKNKVFFFANFERDDRSDLGSNFVPRGVSTEGGNTARVELSDLQLVSDLLRENYNYDVGALTGFTHNTESNKGLLKLDVNVSDVHKLAVTYNFLDAFQDKPAHPSALGARGPNLTTLQTQNAGYRINNKLNSYKVELKSLFSNRIANKFMAGYTSFRDNRDPFSDPFPVINIGKEGQRYIIAGHEPFSINNVLDQDVFQVRNDVNIYAGKHTWTIGGAFERFNFNNSFNLTGYGARVFFPDIDINDVEAVLTSPDFAAEVDGARAAAAAGNWALAETNLGQFSAYIQDEIEVSENFNLTLGLRMDMPLYFNTAELIQENIDRKGGLLADGGTYAPEIEYYDEDNNPVLFDHTELPSQSPLINPRVGFNYDINGDQTSQLRGGTGLFSGRFPFVWIGNQVANPDFFFYNMTDPDFKFPQVWRTNVGYDRKFQGGWIASTDIIYTKDLQAQMVRNFGLRTPSGRLDGPGSRPIYTADDRATIFGGPTNAYVFTNADAGYSFNASFSVERNWGGNYFKVAYNYLQAEDVASIDAEISSDAYDRNPANVLNTNQAELAPSLYGNQHRIIAVGSKVFDWNGKSNFNTTVSLFAEYAQGTRYSYTYNGDINGDGSVLNDLLYIPTSAEMAQLNFGGDNPDAQRAAFNAFIEQDDYLSSRRGQFAEKYGALAPWFSQWDLRILQDISVVGSNKFQVSLDILNVGNLINDSWGVERRSTFTGLDQPVSVSVTDGTPTYIFDSSRGETFFNDFSLVSRWQMQFGLRYIF